MRLELASASLRQMLSQLLELPKPTVDEGALLQKVCENACGGCSVRRNCPGRVQLRTMPATIAAMISMKLTLEICTRL